jgi:hypothetical protein
MMEAVARAIIERMIDDVDDRKRCERVCCRRHS